MLFSAQRIQILTLPNIQDSLSFSECLAGCLPQLRVACFLMIFLMIQAFPASPLLGLPSALEEEGLGSRKKVYMVIIHALPKCHWSRGLCLAERLTLEIQVLIYFIETNPN